MSAQPSVFDIVNTAAQVGSLAVFAGTAIAALAQLRHLRASNELDALLELTDQLRRGHMQRALAYVQFELDTRLEDAAYRRELSTIGFVDATRHPEMEACNWFNQAGAFVKNGLIDEGTFLDLFSRLVAYYWTRLEPVVALLRRERGAGEYENFEYLAMLASRWKARHAAGAYPARSPRLTPRDPWLAVDSTDG